MGPALLLFGSAIVAIVAAVLSAYLQRIWTPDPRPQIAALAAQLTTFQDRVEAIEQERAELENFSLDISLQQVAGQDCSISVKNSSDREVEVESVNFSYEGVLLSKPTKPKPTEDWKIGPRSSKQISWRPDYPPVTTLRWIDPGLPRGRCIVVTLVLDCKIGGKPKTITTGKSVTVDFTNNQMTPYGP